MVRVRKARILMAVVFLVGVISLGKLLLKRSGKRPQAEQLMHQQKNFSGLLQKLVILVREFENFDNDIVETSKFALKACEHKCHVLIASNSPMYPPLKLPPHAKHVVLSADLFHPAPNLQLLLSQSRYVLLLPDGARVSSPSQLKDMMHLLDSLDTQVIVVAVGSSPLTCYRYELDIPAWTLVVSPAPDSEACDGIGGRAALMLHTSYLLNLTYPLARPSVLSIGIQGTAKGWKMHVSRGGVFGEGRQLFANEHLQWKLQTVEEERVKSLYGSLGVKKVVGSSRKVEWYGCSRTTPRCFPTVIDDIPSYLYQGRWTPPCCLEGLRITARHVFQSLKACRVRWWLEGGSLLGAVRTGDIIPWDYDVDIGIYAKDVDRCPQLKSSRWQTLEDTEGFVWQKASEGNFYRVHYSAANHLHVDIFPFIPHDGMMTRGGAWDTGHRQDVDFPEHFLRPLATVSFVGVMAAAPNNVRDFLELKFGTGVLENPQYPNPELLASHNISLPIPD